MSRTVGLVVRSLLGRYHWLLWAAGIAAGVGAGIALLVGALGADIAHSRWEHAGSPARWVLFVVGIMITPVILPPYLAHGLTRRTVTTAAAIAGMVLAAAVALYLAGGFLVERAVRPYPYRGGHLFTDPGQVHLVVAEYGLVGTAYLVSGWLIGSGYYRFGGGRGTLALPLGILPAVATENVLGTGQWAGIGPPTLGLAAGTLPAAGAVGLAAAVLALGLAALRALTRDAPIRTTRGQA